MANTFLLQVGACGNETEEHLYQLVLFPSGIGFLLLAVQVLKICIMIHVLSDDTESECVVHGLSEVVPIKFDYVSEILHLAQLHSFLLILVEFIEGLRLYFFQRVDFICLQMLNLVDLCMFLA
jgi:hypothetical protein